MQGDNSFRCDSFGCPGCIRNCDTVAHAESHGWLAVGQHILCPVCSDTLHEFLNDGGDIRAITTPGAAK
jgi:hypothetical protein